MSNNDTKLPDKHFSTHCPWTKADMEIMEHSAYYFLKIQQRKL